MLDPVKPKRTYNSKRRLEQAGETRAAVIAAARKLFVEAGWTATTIAAVARAAGVSAETIYAVFSSKQRLLAAVIETTLRRGRPEAPLLDQAGPQAVARATSHAAQIDLFAADIAEVLEGVAPLMAVVRSAAETDAAMLALYSELHAGRRRNLGFVAAALVATGPLRDGLDEAEATQVLWRLASPELFLLLTDIEGMDRRAYADWLAGALRDGLLDGKRPS